MDIKPKSQILQGFNMSAMTDVVFLLLIFIMISANFITPSGLDINLPKSAETTAVPTEVVVTITEGGDFYLNQEKILGNELNASLTKMLRGAGKKSVTIYSDKKADVELLVQVAGIASANDAKITIAALQE
jgi:biopolymer transport protein ExbD